MFNKEAFEKHYRERFNVKTAFFSMKQKLGDSLKSKNPVAQKNELICKAIAYNILVLITEMYELGVDCNFGAGPRILAE